MPKANYFKREWDPSTVGVLLTSHPRQQCFWDECLPSWNDTPYHVIMGYDDKDWNQIVPHMDRFPGIAEVFCTGDRFGHVCGELEQMKIGFMKLYDAGCRYSMKLAADFKVNNPNGVRKLWEMLEEPRYDIVGEGQTGGQIIGDATGFMFGMSGILAIMFRDFDRFKKKGGSAEMYAIRRRRMMNISRVKPKVNKFEILDMVHLQGVYAKFSEMSIQKTWEIGEIWK